MVRPHLPNTPLVGAALPLLLLLGLLTAPGAGSPEGGLTWHRNCSSTEDVVLKDAEGIIETPIPTALSANCGSPLSPGICCRWAIRVADPRLWVQIAVLDSTIPVRSDGHCYSDNEVTVLDASSRRVAAVCGPVGTARTVVVRSAGAHVGFRGLVSHKAMVTLHYKVIGCEPLPEVVRSHPSVLSVRATAFSANVTCASGDVRRFTCVGRTWTPPPERISCPAVSTTAETTSNIWQSDKRSGSVPDMTSPPITTGQRSHTPGDNNVTLAIGASSGGGPKHKGIDNILLTLMVVGGVVGALLTLTVLLIILRHAGRNADKGPPPTPITPDSISPPLSASHSPALEETYAYPDTYQQLDPRNPNRRVSPRHRDLNGGPEVAPMLAGNEIDDGPEALQKLSGSDMDLPPPPLMLAVGWAEDGEGYSDGVFPLDDGEYVQVRGGEGAFQGRPFDGDVDAPPPQPTYAVPNKNRRHSGLRLVENDIYDT